MGDSWSPSVYHKWPMQTARTVGKIACLSQLPNTGDCSKDQAVNSLPWIIVLFLLPGTEGPPIMIFWQDVCGFKFRPIWTRISFFWKLELPPPFWNLMTVFNCQCVVEEGWQLVMRRYLSYEVSTRQVAPPPLAIDRSILNSPQIVNFARKRVNWYSSLLKWPLFHTIRVDC